MLQGADPSWTRANLRAIVRRLKERKIRSGAGRHERAGPAGASITPVASPRSIRTWRARRACSTRRTSSPG
ncbi:hypothetical protein ACRAWD_31110 [Caulobacter segnis]